MRSTAHSAEAMVASGVLPVHLISPRLSATRAISPAKRDGQGSGWVRGSSVSGARKGRRLPAHLPGPEAMVPIVTTHSTKLTSRHEALLQAKHLDSRLLEDAAAALAAAPPAARAPRPRPCGVLACQV